MTAVASRKYGTAFPNYDDGDDDYLKYALQPPLTTLVYAKCKDKPTQIKEQKSKKKKKGMKKERKVKKLNKTIYKQYL